MYTIYNSLANFRMKEKMSTKNKLKYEKKKKQKHFSIIKSHWAMRKESS